MEQESDGSESLLCLSSFHASHGAEERKRAEEEQRKREEEQKKHEEEMRKQEEERLAQIKKLEEEHQRELEEKAAYEACCIPKHLCNLFSSTNLQLEPTCSKGNAPGWRGIQCPIHVGPHLSRQR